MKRVILCSMMAAFLTVGLSAELKAQTSTPSLGDYARTVRHSKPQPTKASAKVYDNDNIPATTISVVGHAPQTVADASKSETDSKRADSKTADASGSDKTTSIDSKTSEKKVASEIKPGESLEDRQKVIAGWKKRIEDQKKKVEQLTHDLNEFQHNSTLAQVSVWPETQKYNQGLADKQKTLDQAKAELSALQEQARKAGVPAAAVE
jgi:hypothetical protein